MSQQTVTTDEFGVMILNAATNSYEAETSLPYMKSGAISIAAEGFVAGLPRMHSFVTWLNLNHQVFKLSLERAIQDYELVWDDVWTSILGADWVDAEDGFLAEHLSYESVDFNRGKIHLWIDTSGLLTDHKIRVTMDETMQIECCEII
jgi:hypothetical protein